MTSIVLVASHLGAAHGGINVFNAELMRALKSYANLQAVCLVPSMECVDPELRHSKDVISLRSGGRNFGTPADDAVIARGLLAQFGSVDAVVGHDVVTGDLALELAALVGARKILIHHMSYGRYMALIRDPVAAREKEKHQRKLFPMADQSYAVGPLLLDSLNDIRRSSPGMPSPKLLLPPLLDTTPAAAPRSAPRILYSGRIEEENDAVKQGRLAARSIGRAIRNIGGPIADASVDIYGFDEGSALIAVFRAAVESEAGRGVPVKCLPFTESRTEMLDVVRDASLVVMPSVHEGFGLVAWEAMCCGVPLVVSRNSGFYRYLESIGQGMYVDAVTVSGHATEDAADHLVDDLANRIRSRIEHPAEAHIRAERLLDAVRSQGGTKTSLDDFVLDCGHPSAASENQPRFGNASLDRQRLLDVNLVIEVDVGLNDKERIEYRCNTSTRRIQSAILALRSGLSGAGVKVLSSYLDRLLDLARNDPDADVRADAAVRFRADEPKVARLERYFNEALVALASSGFADLHFPDEERASAFVELIEGLNNRASREGKTYIDAVRSEPYMTFSLSVPVSVLEGKDFFRPLFTIADGATLADIWFDCCDDIAAAYLRACLSGSLESGLPPEPLGYLLEWRIGSH